MTTIRFSDYGFQFDNNSARAGVLAYACSENRVELSELKPLADDAGKLVAVSCPDDQAHDLALTLEVCGLWGWAMAWADTYCRTDAGALARAEVLAAIELAGDRYSCGRVESVAVASTYAHAAFLEAAAQNPDHDA